MKFKQVLHSLTISLLTLSLIGLTAACHKHTKETTPTSTVAAPAFVESQEVTDYVMIKMEDQSEIVIKLEPEQAPITVDNFKKLVEKGFYNGLTFHRAVPGFVIQGGDPNGDGSGGSDENITGEFSANGVKNDLADHHERGVVSMARSAISMDSASSQFFIVLNSNEDVAHSLNGQYAAFGKVISGMEEVDKIAELPTNQQMITQKPKMQKVYFVKPNH